MGLFLHIDMNNFYASVECTEREELRYVPVAVAGNPKNRHGVVLAKNQIAKTYGVKTGDTIWEAQMKAPGIVFVPPQFDKYDKISKKMFEICNDYTHRVEPFGPDECWLDCTETTRLLGSGREIADELRGRVKRELGITASVGVSFSKMFAKLGSDMKKPDGTTVITEENFRNIVWPLPAQELCGVGRKTIEKLHRLNLFTIGELARSDERVIGKILGKPGRDLRKIARGESEYGVREAVTQREVKSVGHGLTALRDLTSDEDISALIYYLSELIAVRLRKYGFKASGVSVSARAFDLSRQGRQTTLPYPVASTKDIAVVAKALLDTFHDGRPLRSIDVSAFSLSKATAPLQLSFFDNSLNSAKNERLDVTMEKIRAKYGRNSLLRASEVNQDIFIDKDVGDFLPFKR